MKKIQLLILFLSTLLLVSCASLQHMNIKKSSNEMQISSIPFDINLCEHVAYGNGTNTGIKYNLIDKDTNEPIEGYMEISGSFGTSREGYSCTWEGGERIIISTYARGYSPFVGFYYLPVQKLATITIPMQKSCTGGNSAFDNIKKRADMYYPDNETEKQKYVNELTDDIYWTIQSRLNLSKEEYTLSCIEANLGRGGYVLGKGKTNDGTVFSFNLQSGWCSSGGSGCGFETCYSTTSEKAFNEQKKNICSNINEYVRQDEYICKGPAFDNSTEVRDECMNGKYDIINGEIKTISVNQIRNRCYAEVNYSSIECPMI